MARISMSLSGIERTILNRLADADAAVATSTLRLATLQKINYPRDDPSGFVTLANFQTQLSDVTAAVNNVHNASSSITQTQTNLGQILTQLESIRTELGKDDAESQGNIDQAIDQINNLSAATVNGRHMLDGSADFLVAGRNSTQVASISVEAAPSAPQTIGGRVTHAATQGTLTYTGSGGKTNGPAQFVLTGDLGGAQINVADQQNLSDVATAINDQSHLTGVTASVQGDQLALQSVHYGSNAPVSVAVTSGTFIVSAGNTATDTGSDVQAIINNHAYTGTTTDQGDQITVNQNGLRFDINFAAGFAGTFNPMTVSGGALRFALSPDLSQKATLGIPGLQPGRLGGPSGNLSQIASGGPYSGLGHNTSQALRIVNEAIGQVTRVKGNVDGFYNAAIKSASGLLSGLQTDLTDSINSIDEVDPAEEQSNLSHAQALTSNAIASLAILNQQRMQMVQLIKKIAGLD